MCILLELLFLTIFHFFNYVVPQKLLGTDYRVQAILFSHLPEHLEASGYFLDLPLRPAMTRDPKYDVEDLLGVTLALEERVPEKQS
jgi:hypothetical protein